MGADFHITPREIIRDFIELLDILYQHPTMRIEEVLNSKEFRFAPTQLEEQAPIGGSFAEFKL